MTTPWRTYTMSDNPKWALCLLCNEAGHFREDCPQARNLVPRSLIPTVPSSARPRDVDTLVKVRLTAIASVNGVTLNGEPAAVGGQRNDFATVTSKLTGLSAEWSWHAVSIVLRDNEGRFSTL